MHHANLVAALVHFPARFVRGAAERGTPMRGAGRTNRPSGHAVIDRRVCRSGSERPMSSAALERVGLGRHAAEAARSMKSARPMRRSELTRNARVDRMIGRPRSRIMRMRVAAAETLSAITGRRGRNRPGPTRRSGSPAHAARIRRRANSARSPRSGDTGDSGSRPSPDATIANTRRRHRREQQRINAGDRDRERLAEDDRLDARRLAPCSAHNDTRFASGTAAIARRGRRSANGRRSCPRTCASSLRRAA